MYIIPKFSNNVYIDNNFGFEKDERYSSKDPHHLSADGHKKLAQKLYQWLQK
jgi:lysophospholipase L1-like esterase